MSFYDKLIIFSATVIATASISFWASLHQVPQPPQLDKWWGPGQPHIVDETIRTFNINISEEVLQDLAKRLEITTPLLIEKETSEYGFDINYLNEVITHWKTKYDWRSREEFLNRYPHFKTNIQGLDIHFIHVKPKNLKKPVQVLPLLLIHGWPGSVREFYKIIPLLTKPRDDAHFVFEIIVPSLPGYGFSDRASKPGFGSQYIAVVMKNLMERLGFSEFYVHGGDWGATVVENLSILFPESILGIHSNTCKSNTLKWYFTKIIGSFFPFMFSDEIQCNKIFTMEDIYTSLMEKFCFTQNHSAKSDAINRVALRDSPAGLAAYILEKFSTWTEGSSGSAGGLANQLTMTDLLDNIMIYWITGAIANSPHLFNDAHLGLKIDSIPATVPTGCAVFPQDLFYTSKTLIGGKFPNLVRYKDMPRGGHFPALEEPELLSNEVWETVKFVEYKKYTMY